MMSTSTAASGREASTFSRRDLRQAVTRIIANTENKDDELIALTAMQSQSERIWVSEVQLTAVNTQC